MKLVDKDKIVAEIERRVADNKKDIERASHKNLEDYFEGYEDALVLFKEKFIDTLEVKEVDLEKEFDKYTKDISAQDIKEEPFTQLFECAKHFYELGLKIKRE